MSEGQRVPTCMRRAEVIFSSLSMSESLPELELLLSLPVSEKQGCSSSILFQTHWSNLCWLSFLAWKATQKTHTKSFKNNNNVPFDLGVLQFSVKTQPSTETISSHRVSFKRQSDTITCVSTSFNISSQLIHSEAANFYHNLWHLAKFFAWHPTSSIRRSQLLQFATSS